MKDFLTSSVVMIICILILISSIFQAELVNHNFWWQVIGMGVVTFVVGRYYLDQFRTFKDNHKK